ncbi:MAG: LamG domain-containing protein [Bacteroidota bacterium]|nr:LamG domain-containing protein [Bacteroidota bacterium]
MKSAFFLTVTILALFSFTCKEGVLLDPENQADLGKITISLQNTPDEIVRVVATVSREGHQPKSITLSINSTNQSASGSFTGITPGIWHLKVEAFDGNGILRYSGETDVEVIEGQICLVQLVLEPTTSEIQILVTWGGSSVTRGLVLYLPFDGDTKDKSGYSNHGYSDNTNYTNDPKGRSDSAYLFNGTDNYITVFNSLSINPTKQLTISLWLRFDSIQSNYTDIFAKVGPVIGYFENRQYYLAGKQNVLLWYPQFKSAGDGQGQHELDSREKSFQVGQWIFFTFIIDRINHKMKMFANGILIKEVFDSYSTFNINSYPLLIGSSVERYYGHSPFKGAIDEFRLYNRVLSNNEIKTLYNH